MTATHSIAPTLLVAIDISKHRHEVLIGIPGKTRRRRLTVMNTLEDFERYIAKDRHNAHLRRKAYTAIAAKMARTVHAVVNHGEPYRPFFEGVSPGGRTSL